MLCSENETKRKEGIEKIIQIRQRRCKSNLGDKSVRIRKTSELNPTATNLTKLIAWKKAYEPQCTCAFTTVQLKEYFSKPMAVPDWPCLAQSIKRRVNTRITAVSKSTRKNNWRFASLNCKFVHIYFSLTFPRICPSSPY